MFSRTICHPVYVLYHFAGISYSSSPKPSAWDFHRWAYVLTFHYPCKSSRLMLSKTSLLLINVVVCKINILPPLHPTHNIDLWTSSGCRPTCLHSLLVRKLSMCVSNLVFKLAVVGPCNRKENTSVEFERKTLEDTKILFNRSRHPVRVSKNALLTPETASGSMNWGRS